MSNITSTAKTLTERLEKITWPDRCDSDIAETCREAKAEIERLRAGLTALFPPETKRDDGSSMIHDADENLDAVIYDLEQRGVDKVCIGSLKRIMEQLLKARAALSEAPSEGKP